MASLITLYMWKANYHDRITPVAKEETPDRMRTLSEHKPRDDAKMLLGARAFWPRIPNIHLSYASRRKQQSCAAVGAVWLVSVYKPVGFSTDVSKETVRTQKPVPYVVTRCSEESVDIAPLYFNLPTYSLEADTANMTTLKLEYLNHLAGVNKRTPNLHELKSYYDTRLTVYSDRHPANLEKALPGFDMNAGVHNAHYIGNLPEGLTLGDSMEHMTVDVENVNSTTVRTTLHTLKIEDITALEPSDVTVETLQSLTHEQQNYVRSAVNYPQGFMRLTPGDEQHETHAKVVAALLKFNMLTLDLLSDHTPPACFSLFNIVEDEKPLLPHKKEGEAELVFCFSNVKDLIRNRVTPMKPGRMLRKCFPSANDELIKVKTNRLLTEIAPTVFEILTDPASIAIAYMEGPSSCASKRNTGYALHEALGLDDENFPELHPSAVYGGDSDTAVLVMRKGPSVVARAVIVPAKKEYVRAYIRDNAPEMHSAFIAWLEEQEYTHNQFALIGQTLRKIPIPANDIGYSGFIMPYLDNGGLPVLEADDRLVVMPNTSSNARHIDRYSPRALEVLEPIMWQSTSEQTPVTPREVLDAASIDDLVPALPPHSMLYRADHNSGAVTLKHGDALASANASTVVPMVNNEGKLNILYQAHALKNVLSAHRDDEGNWALNIKPVTTGNMSISTVCCLTPAGHKMININNDRATRVFELLNLTQVSAITAQLFGVDQALARIYPVYAEKDPRLVSQLHPTIGLGTLRVHVDSVVRTVSGNLDAAERCGAYLTHDGQGVIFVPRDLAPASDTMIINHLRESVTHTQEIQGEAA